MSNQHSYGGQAVIEGVMMRGKQQATVAVRQPTGMIAYKHFPLNIQSEPKWSRLPLLRGIVMLWDMLNLGTKALHFSASAAAGEQQEHTHGSITGALVTALFLAITLFFVLPLVLAGLAGYLGLSSFLCEILEGLLRLGFVVGYIAAISYIPDIQRLFGYHGAEHKTVNAYEAGAPLTVDSVRTFTHIHPRCGTSFLLVVVVVSFFIFLFLGGLPFWMKLLSRVVFIPLIAALAYEFLRMAAANYHRVWVRALLTPTLAIQQLTTREPDDSMIATAIAALQSVLAADGVHEVHVVLRDDTAFAISA